MIRLGVTLLLMVLSLPGNTATVTELQQAGRLQLATALAPTQNIVPGQKLILTIEVATDTWFSGGTRIAIPEVPGLVILQTEQFASNASENRGGTSWVVQRWHLDVYPQRDGDFDIPPLALSLQVNDGSGRNVAGELAAPGLDFRVTTPPELAEVSHWVAAPAFSVRQNFDRPLESLQRGDAFEREIQLQASGVLAMMLPAVGVEQVEGLATYPLPPELENRNNRGVSTARRVQRVSYVAEQEGSYQLPAREFFWWDTAAGELQLLSLEPVDITVGPGSPAPRDWTALAITASRWGLLALGLLLLWVAAPRLGRLLPPLRRAQQVLHHAWQRLRTLTRPALPNSLNPGSNAGD